MEDNLMMARGRPVRHNAELVTRAVELATLMQRPPMGTDRVRELLQVKDHRRRP
jgi:uncharacterized protein (DUF849 family)